MRFSFLCRISTLKGLLNQITWGGVKNLPAGFNNRTCVALTPLNQLSFFLCHGVRIFCFKFRVPWVLIAHFKWIAIPCCLNTSLKWACLCAKNICADQICTNRNILALLKLEYTQAFWVSGCAQHIITLIHVFGFFTFLLRGFRLWKFDWTYLVPFTMFVNSCVSRILRISNSLFYLVSFWTNDVFVMERVIGCRPVFCSWDGLCSCDVTYIEHVSTWILGQVSCLWAGAWDVFDVKIISHKFSRRRWLDLKRRQPIHGV